MRDRETGVPFDVPFTRAYVDPSDSQRRWALGWAGATERIVFLSSWRDDETWLTYDVEDSSSWPTPERVELWSQMLRETA